MIRPTPFDFDTIVPRHQSGSFKWDSNPNTDVLPMWVADMDFQAAPVILEALSRRVAHGIFGYALVPDAYYQALSGWFERRHGFAIQPEWVLTTTGVVPAISAILRALTVPGDGVIVQTPVYHCFFSSIRNQSCKVVENPLRMDNGRYDMDFDDLEQKAANPRNNVLLLCHPHNPSGRVWTEQELRQLGDICTRHGVVVISDEIHCDLLFPGVRHRPFAALDPQHLAQSITLSSPSKSFNLAGLHIANIVVADPALKSRLRKALQIHDVAQVNPFGVVGTIAAYNEGEPWMDALLEYLYSNYQTIQTFLKQHLPQLTLYPQQSTYLAWIDTHKTGLSSDELAEKLLSEGNLRISSGSGFLPSPQPSQSFIRLNFACPQALLNDGLQRLHKVCSA